MVGRGKNFDLIKTISPLQNYLGPVLVSLCCSVEITAQQTKYYQNLKPLAVHKTMETTRVLKKVSK